MKELKPHPLADLLPLMTPAEHAALRDDIAANGVREPIVLYEGKILDGRNRYAVCQELSRECPTRDYNPKREGPALAYVYSKAVHRNLTDSQKAAAAVGIMSALEKDAEARKLAHLRQFSSDREPVPARIDGKTRDQYRADLLCMARADIEKAHGKRLAVDASKLSKVQLADAVCDLLFGPRLGRPRDVAGTLFGVSGRYVQAAKALKAKSPKLFDQVFVGELPITRAHRLVLREAKAKELRRKASTVQAELTGDAVQVLTGDCVELLAKQATGAARLVFWDPPYNLGFHYDADPTGDNLPHTQYLAWCQGQIREFHRVLADDGTLCILHCEEYQHHIGLLIQQAGFTIRRLVVWYERFGENCTKNFNRCTRFLYYAVKDPRAYTFNEEAFQVESARAAVYKDKRSAGPTKNLDSLWDLPRLQGTSAERVCDVKAPTQIPLSMMNRVVNGFTNPGDLVIDPCCGTGTTGEACVLASRRFVGIEQSPRYAASARTRIALAQAEPKKAS